MELDHENYWSYPKVQRENVLISQQYFQILIKGMLYDKCKYNYEDAMTSYFK